MIFSNEAVWLSKEMKSRFTANENNGNNNGKAGGTYYRHVPPHDGPSHLCLLEHQPGFEKASMSWITPSRHERRQFVVWRRNFISLNKRAVLFPRLGLPKEDQLSLLDTIAKSWFAQDGFWFQGVEFSYGINERNGATILHGPGSLL